MIQDIKNNKRASILGYPIDLLKSMEEAVSFIESYIKSGQGGHVVTLNPEMIMQSLKNDELGNILKNADLVIPDGIGVVIALRKLNINDVNRLPGIEFSELLIKKCAENGYPVGFLGAATDVIECAIKELKIKYPELKVAYSHNGFFNEEEEAKIIEDLKNAQPKVLFVALGVPKQELWIAKYKNILNSTTMVGVGGSFDVWSNKIQRAPLLYRKFGLEWLYRLLSQPSRFSRIFPTIPLFFLKVALDNRNTRKEY